MIVVINLNEWCLRPVSSEDLKELISKMLDKNSETRVSIPEIKVREGKTTQMDCYVLPMIQNDPECC